MKKLKKFNENWIDDETEDTNRRMTDLDQEEGINNNSDWKDPEAKIEPLGNDMNIMEELLDKYEEECGSLEETSCEEIQVIKKALWIGYTYKK